MRTATRCLAAVFVAMEFLPGTALGAMAPFNTAQVNWAEAVGSFPSTDEVSLTKLRSLKGFNEAVKKLGPQTSVNQPFGRDLLAINAVTSILRPKVQAAGSPVLLPMEIGRLAKDMVTSGLFVNKDKTSSYFGGLRPLAFYPGPYGYRAYFRLKKTSTVMIAGSSVFYKIPNIDALPKLASCRELSETARKARGNDEAANKSFHEYLARYEKNIGLTAAEYFGETEAAIPCLFSGALVEVHILCNSIGDPDCRVEDLARSIISRLAFVGGSPRPTGNPSINDPLALLTGLVQRLETESERRTKIKLPKYNKPGELLPNSGVDGKDGSPDSGVYGPILFPTHQSATAQTVVFRTGQHCLPGNENTGETCIHSGRTITKAKIGDWRDNFCEYRAGNRLYTCPAGRGHAGQDIWGEGWKPGIFPLRSITDGIAFRRFPAQPAVTVSDVYGTNIDYIYRHMRPTKLTENGILEGTPTPVRRGCTLALVDRLQGLSRDGKQTSLSDGGRYYVATAPHLHFEVRVPTQAGYQNVSPYWTVAHAHKSLLTAADTAPVSSTSCANE